MPCPKPDNWDKSDEGGGGNAEAAGRDEADSKGLDVTNGDMEGIVRTGAGTSGGATGSSAAGWASRR